MLKTFFLNHPFGVIFTIVTIVPILAITILDNLEEEKQSSILGETLYWIAYPALSIFDPFNEAMFWPLLIIPVLIAGFLIANSVGAIEITLPW